MLQAAGVRLCQALKLTLSVKWFCLHWRMFCRQLTIVSMLYCVWLSSACCVCMVAVEAELDIKAAGLWR